MKPQPNEIIKKNVIEQLAWNDNLNINDIFVDVEDNTVILKGTVNSHSSKLEAARETLLAARNYSIDNQLKVKFNSRKELPNDREIIENIQNILKWNDSINPINIQVEAENGKVTLSGTVSRTREKDKAENIASSTKGVVDVENKIVTEPSAIRPDKQIENDVKNALERNPLIDLNKIFIEVKKGIIYLSGSVANEIIRKEIHDIAFYTRGVVDVVDEITTG